MTKEKIVLGCFCWLIPNGAMGAFLGLSEKFGFELLGCEPNLAAWLRYGILQYMLISWALAYYSYIPRKYADYIELFWKEGATPLMIAFLFALTQVMTPWITLVLYLNLKRRCGDRISSGQNTLTWVLFAFQVILFVVGSFVLYMFCGAFKDIKSGYQSMKSRQFYDQRVREISQSRERQRSLYGELLRLHLRYQISLYKVDLLILEVVLSRKLNTNCASILSTQSRLCFACKSGFEVGDKIHFMENCYHIAHWECFFSSLLTSGQCSECYTLCVQAIKRCIMEGPLKDLEKLIATPPCTKPTSFEQTKELNQLPANPRIRPIVRIEYFNYTVDQKTGGEPAEALPAPVAETEI